MSPFFSFPPVGIGTGFYRRTADLQLATRRILASFLLAYLLSSSFIESDFKSDFIHFSTLYPNTNKISLSDDSAMMIRALLGL